MYRYHLILIIKNLSLFIFSFAIALAAAPILSRFLYKYKAWKKKPREAAVGGAATPLFARMHGDKEVSTPRMGGILIWGSVLIVTVVTMVASLLFPQSFLASMSYISRSQTWLPLFTLIAASVLGLFDDIMVIREKGKYVGGGMRFKVRLGLIVLIAIIGAWWFYFKLGWSTIYIPFYGNLAIDGWYMLLFVIVIIATFSSGVVDGLDGLSAGVLIPIFIAFGIIAYVKELYDLVSLLTVIIGALITYLWFNVHPAKFYMGETGMMGLTVTLAVVAFLTNAVLFLPIIGFVLVVESMSVILQLVWRTFFKRKLFLVAPIHHHFEALGWPESQVTMRFWIISSVFSALGLVLYFLAKFF